MQDTIEIEENLLDMKIHWHALMLITGRVLHFASKYACITS
jgi:hypothetical protein